MDAAGPRLRAQVAALEKALAEARTPVAVVIESDGHTEVALSRVGRLGTLTRRTLELRPGEYTVVGSRRGYRDVRRRFTVGPGAATAADRRALRGGPLTAIRVEEGGRSRAVGPAEFPVPLGGAGSPVPVAGSGGPLAWLGLADGEVFVQPSPGASVLCNGARLSASHWLRDGDVLRLGPTRVEVSVRADGVRLVVDGPRGGEPDRAARRPRPAAARRATLAGGRAAPRAPSSRSATRPRRSEAVATAPAGASPPDDRPRGPAARRGRVGRPRVPGWPRSASRSSPSPTRWRSAAAGRSSASARASWRCPAAYTLVAEKEGYRRLEAPVEVTGEAGQVIAAGDAAPAGPPHRGHRRRRRGRGRGGRPDGGHDAARRVRGGGGGARGPGPRRRLRGVPGPRRDRGAGEGAASRRRPRAAADATPGAPAAAGAGRARRAQRAGGRPGRGGRCGSGRGAARAAARAGPFAPRAGHEGGPRRRGDGGRAARRPEARGDASASRRGWAR